MFNYSPLLYIVCISQNQAHCRGSVLSWLVAVVNGKPDSILCLTSLPVLHSMQVVRFVFINT